MAVKSLTACVFSPVRLSKMNEKKMVRFLIGGQVKVALSFHFIGNSTNMSEENLKSATAGLEWTVKKKKRDVKFFLYGKVVNMRKKYAIRNW